MSIRLTAIVLMALWLTTGVCPTPAYGQPYPTSPALPGHASYYTANINGFYDLVNGVWSQVYQWDAGQESTDNTGTVIGGWKQLFHDNLVFDHYTEYGGYWEGFTVSERDYEYPNPDPLNQFSAVTRGGKDGIGTPFMIGYYGLTPTRPGSCRVSFNDGAPCEVAGMYVTNSSYAYLSMLRGDGFAHAFHQGDWFLLTAYGFDAAGRQTTQTEFYLADFRSANAADHYIIKDWRWFNLLSLGVVSSVEFVLTSSDNSVYGMNTPAYFCLDKLTLSLLSIKQQPADKTVCLGQRAVLKTKAVGYDYLNLVFQDFLPRYQWRKDGVNIPGANDTVFTIEDMQEPDAGLYSCVVTSEYQSQQYTTIFNDPTYQTTVTSATARLTTGLPIQITSEPQARAINAGETASFTVATSAVPIAYQWYRNDVAVPGGTGATLTISNAATEDAGEYHCVIRSRCEDLLSHKASLQVKDTRPCLPVQVVASPASATLLGGNNYQLAVTTTGTVEAWQWFRNGWPIPGATTPNWELKHVQLADTGVYYCVVKGTCGNAASVPCTIKVVLPWSVHPNPVGAGQQVTLLGYNGFVCRLTNATGNVLQTFRVNGEAWKIALPYAAGVYFLHGEKEILGEGGARRMIFNYEKVFVR